MRIHGLLVMRNEADRYLECCLGWNQPLVDDLFVYDDGSTDDSVEIATAHGAIVVERPSDVPAFLEHEGQFRQAAWNVFEEAVEPEDGDWVLTFDADEFLLSSDDEATALRSTCLIAAEDGAVAALLPIPEVWAVLDVGDPQIRVDGEWGRISGLRLFRYRAGAEFRDRSMGCGSEPTYAAAGPTYRPRDLFLLHYGYADPADAQAKYARYSALPAGHANAHIQSIAEPPMLRMWDGPYFAVWRGRKSP